MRDGESARDLGLCDTCHLLRDGACSIRGVAIERPASTGCASHPRHGPLRRPFPIGPVVELHDDGPVQLYASPDDRRVREELLDLVGGIHPRGTRELSFREAAVVWQLQQMREPRAFVHLDRIEATRLINESRAAGQGPSWPFAAFGKILEQHAPATSTDDGEFLLRFSLPGRLLLFSSVLVGGAALAGLMALEAGTSRSLAGGSVILHFGLLGGLATVVAGLWLRLGVFVLARAGIPFRATGAPGAEAAGADADG